MRVTFPSDSSLLHPPPQISVQFFSQVPFTTSLNKPDQRQTYSFMSVSLNMCILCVLICFLFFSTLWDKLCPCAKDTDQDRRVANRMMSGGHRAVVHQCHWPVTKSECQRSTAVSQYHLSNVMWEWLPPSRRHAETVGDQCQKTTVASQSLFRPGCRYAARAALS